MAVNGRRDAGEHPNTAMFLARGSFLFEYPAQQLFCYKLGVATAQTKKKNEHSYWHNLRIKGKEKWMFESY